VSDTQLALTIVTAVLAGAGTSFLTLLFTSAQERRDRHREHFSKALQAVTQYEEFPYVVRRRRASDPESERIRISTELRDVQADLTYHCTWLKTESRTVGDAYENLVSNLRRIAGVLIHDAWTSAPIEDDSGMNIADIGPKLAELKPFKEQYLLEIGDHLSIWPRWLRRLTRQS
jgi:hypothetical protein